MVFIYTAKCIKHIRWAYIIPVDACVFFYMMYGRGLTCSPRSPGIPGIPRGPTIAGPGGPRSPYKIFHTCWLLLKCKCGTCSSTQ